MSKTLGQFGKRFGLKKLIRYNFFERPLPKKLSWFRCLGGLALVTFIIQVVTGIFLVFFYVPSASGAFGSVQYTKHVVPYGWLICKLHLVGAQIMVGCVTAHLIRVIFEGAYKTPRELHWVSGTFLLILTILMGYTGSELLGGNVYTWNLKNSQSSSQAYAQPNYTSFITGVIKYEADTPPDSVGVSARRFPFIYAMHVVIIPFIISSFMGLHFAMIRRTGVSEPL